MSLSTHVIYVIYIHNIAVNKGFTFNKITFILEFKAIHVFFHHSNLKKDHRKSCLLSMEKQDIFTF